MKIFCLFACAVVMLSTAKHLHQSSAHISTPCSLPSGSHDLAVINEFLEQVEGVGLINNSTNKSLFVSFPRQTGIHFLNIRLTLIEK